jgi:predicted SAM-dependent methyltransferase
MPWQPDSVDFIYASHLLEYFDWEEGEAACRYWRQLLKAGGVLRLSVPSWDSLVKIENVHGLKEIIGPLFGRWKTSRGWIYHRCVYDDKTLSEMLSRVGFRHVRCWKWETEEERKRHDDYSQAVKHGVPISLNLEGVK